MKIEYKSEDNIVLNTHMSIINTILIWKGSVFVNYI